MATTKTATRTPMFDEPCGCGGRAFSLEAAGRGCRSTCQQCGRVLEHPESARIELTCTAEFSDLGAGEEPAVEAGAVEAEDLGALDAEEEPQEPVEPISAPIVIDAECGECFHDRARIEALDAHTALITCGACGNQQEVEFSVREMQEARKAVEAREAVGAEGEGEDRDDDDDDGDA